MNTPDTPADAPADPYIDTCDAESPAGLHQPPLMCTYEAGHDGPHAAIGSAGGPVFATWSGSDSEMGAAARADLAQVVTALRRQLAEAEAEAMDPELEAAALEGIATPTIAQTYAAGYEAGERDTNQRHLAEVADLAAVIADLRRQLAEAEAGQLDHPPFTANWQAPSLPATCGAEFEGRMCRLAPGHPTPHTDYATQWGSTP